MADLEIAMRLVLGSRGDRQHFQHIRAEVQDREAALVERTDLTVWFEETEARIDCLEISKDIVDKTRGRIVDDLHRDRHAHKDSCLTDHGRVPALIMCLPAGTRHLLSANMRCS